MDNKCVEKLLETVAFSNGCICSVELIRWEHTHFHPSGNAVPTDTDIKLTKRIQEAGTLLNIHLIDHIVIGGNSYLSFKESELL